MTHVGPREKRRFNAEPVREVDYHLDIDFVGHGHRDQRLDVIVPHQVDSVDENTMRPDGLGAHNERQTEPAVADREQVGLLPVYVYLHGGGWTCGDKSATLKYCANQAIGGMVVVNANYRKAPSHHMKHMLQDGMAALDWVRENIASFGGDPTRIVLGGDSAGGQISSLLGAAIHRQDLADRFELEQPVQPDHLRGIIQHCGAVDLSVLFTPGSFLGLGFLKVQLPKHLWRGDLLRAARLLSPIEWLSPGFPPHFVTTSERDFFYGANLNFLQRLRAASIPVETLVYDRSHKRAGHTWQQNFRHPESQEVYRRVRGFVGRVTQLPTALPAVSPALLPA
ncbi:alpha/beta hydrolase [Homoserinimonas sp. OAct 916]|uniref:alpha/beta hydrolase n=1 Tax=Homoserinimonas sp. OAct 916 TaxID=2211450 RepID=UPI000DBEA246|nr:alpha/beta hydrolase [Homoserinimonas sp. OAct 916]